MLLVPDSKCDSECEKSKESPLSPSSSDPSSISPMSSSDEDNADDDELVNIWSHHDFSDFLQ